MPTEIDIQNRIIEDIGRQEESQKMRETLLIIANYRLIAGDGILTIRFKHMARKALGLD